MKLTLIRLNVLGLSSEETDPLRGHIPTGSLESVCCQSSMFDKLCARVSSLNLIALTAEPP